MKKILIIGLGLIGGSFAKALKKHDGNLEIYAFDQNKNLGKTDKIITGFLNFEENFCQNFDLIVISCPLNSYDEIFEKLSFDFEKSDRKTLIIDLGSLKEFVLEKLPKNLLQNFIACHPIAGSEKSGFENSDENLFLEKKFIICNENKNTSLIEKIAKNIGSNIEFIDSKKHDEIYGLVSHLPQFLAFLFKDFFGDFNKSEFLKKALRLRESNADIWGDIFAFNEKNIEKFYFEFFDNLENLIIKIKKNQFLEILQEAKKRQDSLTIKHLEKLDIEKKNIDAKILFYFLAIISFLQIKKIKSYQSFAGSGFKDFILMIKLLEFGDDFLIENLQKNQKKILDLFEELE